MGAAALPKYFQVGRVVAGFAELPGPRRAATFAAELLGDPRLREYARRNYAAVARRTRAGGKAEYREARAGRAPAWKRRLGGV